MSPIIIMSALTGKPTHKKIFEYLKTLRDNGIEQVMVYPRSGCEIKYLGEEWYDTIMSFICVAEELNMGLWLYDDFNWPSGDAKGMVTAIEQFRLKSIKTMGDEIGTVSFRSLHNSELFGEKFFPDLLSEEAVDYFIKCTHEKYYEHFGEYFGNVIKGIFTDEPAIGYCCDENSIPYYDNIQSDYNEYCGRDFYDDMYNHYTDFYRYAIEVISRQFKKSFISKISDWCRSHGIIMTGHLLADDNPFDATRQNGNILKNLSSFMMPGIDEIQSDFSNDNELILFGTAEYARGKNGAMAELFALGPCDMSYAKKRCMIYFAACHKIDHYFLAISHMDMRGNVSITDYFNNFMSDQPDFPGMRLLSEEAAIASDYARKDYVPDIYIRYPTSICANNIICGVNLERFTKLINRLTYYQIQWKFIDDNDDCREKPVIEFTNDFEYIFDGKIIFDEDEICSMIGCHITVTDEEGNIPNGIFVRRFSQSSIIVLNLFGSAGRYMIGEKLVYLDEYGIYISDKYSSRELQREKISSSFEVGYCNPNMIRTMYVNSQTDAKILCQDETNVIFAIRKDTTAYIDGQEIICNNKSSVLSDGIRQLYGTSDSFWLKNDVNIIKSEKDFKYMPSVFVIGNFSAEAKNGDICSIKLSPRKKSFLPGETFSDYGKIELSTDIMVPNNVKAIEIIGTKLYTCLYANDELLGEKIVAPYIYEIDKSWWNKKMRLKLIQHSSMAPIFGNVDFWDEKSESVQWKGAPSTGKTLFGFEQINWIY